MITNKIEIYDWMFQLCGQDNLMEVLVYAVIYNQIEISSKGIAKYLNCNRNNVSRAVGHLMDGRAIFSNRFAEGAESTYCVNLDLIEDL